MQPFLILALYKDSHINRRKTAGFTYYVNPLVDFGLSPVHVDGLHIADQQALAAPDTKFNIYVDVCGWMQFTSPEKPGQAKKIKRIAQSAKWQ